MADKTALEHLEARYRDSVRAWFERLTFKGLPPTGAEVSLPLEQVYVELSLLAEVPDAADDFSAAERRLLHEAQQRGAQVTEEQRELEALRYERWMHTAREDPDRREKLEVLETKLEAPAVVLLGDPGSGKTTLLHVLALRAARPGPGQRLPVFLPLAAYDDYLRRTGERLPLERFLPLYHARWRGLPGLEPLFQHALEEGRALLLLDGLDEVMDVETRRYVAAQVEELLRAWMGRGNRFVLTSRFIGYREARLPHEVPHYMVLDFGWWERERFAYQWCEAYEVWAAGGERSREVEQRAREQAQRLVEEVEGNGGVGALASNPLLLTLLALLRRELGGPLPVRRIELYERYVRLLLENWEGQRSEGARRVAAERLEPEGMQWHLMGLALWLHQHRPSGTARRADLVRALAEQVLRREGTPPSRATAAGWERAEARAGLVLQEVKDLAGLLGERGQDAYGFLHLSFQEYFVGRALASQSPEDRWEWVRPHLHEPRWREPLRWCAAWLGVLTRGPDALADLLGRVLGAASESEEVLHRDLLLAAAMGAEDVPHCAGLLDGVVERLGVLGRSRIVSLRRRALRGVEALMRQGHAPAEQCFLGWLEQRHELKELLSSLPSPLHESASARLRGELLVLLGDSDSDVRSALSNRIEPLVDRDDRVRDTYLALLTHSIAPVRSHAFDVLLRRAEWDEGLRPRLLDWFERWGAEDTREAHRLCSLAEIHPDAWDALMARLAHPEATRRWALAHELRGEVDQSAHAREALLARLHEEEDPDVLRELVDAVGLHTLPDERLRDSLRTRLGMAEEEPPSPSPSALVHRFMVDRDEQTLEQLLAWLDGKTRYDREEVVQALRDTAHRDERVRHALVARLEDEDKFLRLNLIDVLEDRVGRDEQVRRALLLRLEDKDVDVRLAATKALQGRVGRDEQVRQAFLLRLGDEHQVRYAVCSALRGEVDRDARVRGAFLARLGLEESMACQRYIIQALGSLASRDEEVRHAVRAWRGGEVCVPPSEIVRTLELIGAGLGQDERVRETLRAWSAESGRLDVQLRIDHALGDRADRDERVRDALLVRLERAAVGDARDRLAHALLPALERDERVRDALLAHYSLPGYTHPPELAQALGTLARSDERVRQWLLARLDLPDPKSQEEALGALAFLAPEDAEVRQRLVAWLNTSEFRWRGHAARALGSLPRPGEDVCRALLHLLDDARERRRRPGWTSHSLFIDGVMQDAAHALRTAADQHEETRVALLARFDDEELVMRRCVVEALSIAVERHEDVRRALLTRLDDVTGVRQRIILALAPLVGGDPGVREALRVQLDDEKGWVRSCASEVLAIEVERNEGVRRALLARLRDLDVRLDVSWPRYRQRYNPVFPAMGVLAVRDPEARQALLGLLADDGKRAWIIESLGPCVGPHPEVREALLAHLESPSWDIRATVVKTLLAHAPELLDTECTLLPWSGAVVPHYDARASDDPIEDLRRAVAERLGRLCLQDEGLVDRLEERLHHPRWKVREGAARALLSVPGGPPSRAVPALLGLREDQRDADDWNGRLTVAEALLNVADRETSRWALELAMSALEHGSQPEYYESVIERVRGRAVEVLEMLDPLYREERVLQRLLRLMREGSDKMRDKAYHAVLRLLVAPSEFGREPSLPSA